MADCCKTCVFWKEELTHRDPNDDQWGFGWCRRHPPQLVSAIVEKHMPPLRYGQQIDDDMDSLELVSATKFPSTNATNWCGEFDDGGPVVPV